MIPRADTAARVSKPQSHWLVADWLGLIQPARGESCFSGQRRGSPQPGRIGSHPWIRNPSVSLQLQQPGGETEIPPVVTAPHNVKTPTPPWLIADYWLGLIVEPLHGERGPPGQRRGSAAPGEDKFPSSDRKSFHVSTTPSTRGQKLRSPRVDTAPHDVETTTPLDGC